MVISGDDRGKTGRVISVMPKERKAIVEGINMMTRHVKPNAENTEGGRVQSEASINVSKLMLVDPKTNKPTRVGRVAKDIKGKSQLVRVSAKSKEEIK